MPISMDSNRTNEVVARVVAWHNRHPLARRITAAQVNSVGVVALPFVTTAERSQKPLRADLIAPREVVEPGFAPPTLDEVVMPGEVEAAPATDAQPAQVFSVPAKPWAKLDPRVWLHAFMRLIRPRSRAGFQSVFNEDFIAPLSPERVARWALKYGNTTRPGDPDWPLREIAPDAAMQSLALAAPGVEPFTLFLTAAAIDAPSGRLRVLLGRSGPGDAPHVIGPRDLSPLRKAVAGVLATITLALAGWVGYGHDRQQLAPPEAVISSASVHADAASQAASAPASAASALPAASAPVAAPSAPAASMAVAATPVQHAPSAPTAAARTAPASTVAPSSTRTARSKPASAPRAPPAPSTPAHSLALEQRPSLYDAPKTINEMAIALHDKSWIPESVKQAALLEGKRLRASAAEAAAHPKPAMPPPASAPDDGKDGHALPGPGADRSVGKTKPAVAAKPGMAGADVAAEPQYYALVTKPSSSKLEAEARMIMLRAAAANAIAPRGTRIELLQTQADWQAVWWPFAKREDAERARQLLTVRGVLVEMVAF